MGFSDPEFLEYEKVTDYHYAAGDRVRVRADLEPYVDYRMFGDANSSNTALPEMIELSGQVVTISELRFGQYRVAECGFYWTDEMFEGLEEPDGVVFDFDLEELF